MTKLTANTGPAQDAPVPWWYPVALLLAALLLLLALNELMDAGARVDDAGVQRFDMALADDGDMSGPGPMRLPRNCRSRGECSHRYRIGFDHDPAGDGPRSTCRSSPVASRSP